MIPPKQLAQFRSIIEKSTNIHVYSHAYPDGDAISSMAAMKYFLLSIGKKVICRCDTKIGPMYKWFNLEATSKHHLTSPDCIIVLDTGQTHQLGKLYNSVKNDFLTLPVINIDHHILTNDKYGQLNVLHDAASTTHILYELFHKWSFKINNKVADFLLYGLISDTYFFQKSNTTSKVLSLAAKLSGLGADPSIVAQLLHKNKSIDGLKFWGEVLSSMQIYEAGEIALATISQDTFLKYNVEEYALNLDGLVNFMTAIETAKITVLLKERNDEIRVSFRSDYFRTDTGWAAVNVSNIARQFGGGGHITASGCSIKSTLEEAKKLLLDACASGLKGNLYYKEDKKNEGKHSK